MCTSVSRSRPRWGWRPPAAPPGLGPPAPPEEVGEDVADPAAEAAAPAEALPEVAGVEARAEDPAARVVGAALLGVGQDRVGLLDVLEALLRSGIARVLVRVVLPRELAVGL